MNNTLPLQIYDVGSDQKRDATQADVDQMAAALRFFALRLELAREITVVFPAPTDDVMEARRKQFQRCLEILRGVE